ncbi:DNA polymerase III subunit epsilon [Corynebacterium anserum]|uniref:DNA polymerase III subunit epsilon n=1 Tax=Corynebacterium anserum TaxID=2684406 RepID=A0A7G7YQH0_9CORY|nr:DNA polymerase III subunit epsilon [Corynebacterium anserum]MBC2682426.1 DNA polymerase III subunit epsilon [Corynebacterium anserum]QNH96740.1 DNA polymerase III subunit epsilon [Corynebacterium anserum]
MNTRRRPRRTVHRRAASPSVPSSSPSATVASSASSQKSNSSRSRRKNDKPRHFPTPSEAPIAAVSIATTGIHPTTARLVALSVVFYSESHEEVSSWTRHMNPGGDPGPWHLHGYFPGDLAQSLGFANTASLINEALDGRSLIMHQAAYTWGFLTYEFKRAQRSANRGRRSRGRNRPARKVPSPTPVEILDTLATARRQSTECFDFRLRAIVGCYNNSPHPVHAPDSALPHVGAVASQKRGKINPDTLLEADARLTMALYHTQLRAAGAGAGMIEKIDPSLLTADSFGLQRSAVRVDAANAPRPYENPGQWIHGSKLVQGMEFVVSPDVASEPDEIIQRGVAAGLAYSEKLNRRSSLVVCNTNYELRGKAMHAERKGIPLVDDKLFLTLLNDVEPGTKASTPLSPHAGVRPNTQGMNAPRRINGFSGTKNNSGRNNPPGRAGSRSANRIPEPQKGGNRRIRKRRSNSS